MKTAGLRVTEVFHDSDSIFPAYLVSMKSSRDGDPFFYKKIVKVFDQDRVDDLRSSIEDCFDSYEMSELIRDIQESEDSLESSD